jgi:5-(carboxyamino)imidazole ribonucleotide synthase
MSAAPIFLPGSTVGVMGGGQLGRMFAIAARRMGYRVHTFSPDGDTPTGQLADREVVAKYSDERAVRDFARGIDVLTFEFENIPVECIDWAADHCVVRPAGRVLHICQHRLREKEFLAAAGLPLPPFAAVSSTAELAGAVSRLGLPGVLKTAGSRCSRRSSIFSASFPSSSRAASTATWPLFPSRAICTRTTFSM